MKRVVELAAARRAYRKTCDLQSRKPDSIEFGTQLVMFEKLFRKLSVRPDGYWSEQYDLMRGYLENPEIQRAISDASEQIRKIAVDNDRQAINAANNQIRAFRKQARKGKHIGVGYGQHHRKTSGGAFEINRRKH